MRKKILIYCHPWNENIGGNIVLHKLCDLLNKKGCKAKLYFADYSDFGSQKYWIKKEWFKFRSWAWIYGNIKNSIKSYNLGGNHLWNTPISHWINNTLFSPSLSNKEIMVYPEVVERNPAKAKHVVRFLLYPPGVDTQVV